MKYGILLYTDVEPIDVGATFGVLSMARRIVPKIEAIGIAREAGLVTCANGLQVVASYDFSSAPEIDALIVTGGPGWVQAAQDRATCEYIRSFAEGQPDRVTSICTGAMILDAAGLLAGRTVATKSRVYDGEISPAEILQARNINSVDAGLVWSRGLLSSGGVTLGIDAMFALLDTHHGSDVATTVASVMEYDRALEANRHGKGHLMADA